MITLEKQNTYKVAYKAAFPHTIPVLTGYLFIGIAFGVMFADKGYNFLWAGLMSLLVYAGSGQYLAVNFFDPSVSFLQVIFLTFMVNVRHIFYGLSLLDKFKVSGKKKPYMIFSLTDETYSLYFLTKTPPDVDEGKFLFALATLNQSYWIVGSMIGALAGTLIPFNSKGIDFAMCDSESQYIWKRRAEIQTKEKVTQINEPLNHSFSFYAFAFGSFTLHLVL